MKHLFTYLLVLLTVTGCGSSKKSSHQTYHEEKNETKTEASNEKIQTQGISFVRTDKSVNTDTSGFTRITLYNDSGGIQSVQETWWETRHNELESGTEQSSENAVEEKNNESTSTISTDTLITADEKKDNDNRPVQGIEWIYFVLSAGVVLIVIALIIYYKVKKR